jgi:hypothetical protein
VTGPMVHTIFVRSQSLGGAFSNMLDIFTQTARQTNDETNE